MFPDRIHAETPPVDRRRKRTVLTRPCLELFAPSTPSRRSPSGLGPIRGRGLRLRRAFTASQEQPFTLSFQRQLLELPQCPFRHHARSRLLFQQLQHVRRQVQNGQDLRDPRPGDAESSCEIGPRLATLVHCTLPVTGDPDGVGSWSRGVLIRLTASRRQLFPREVVPLLAGPAFLAAIDPERDLDGQKNSGSVPERGANPNICSGVRPTASLLPDRPRHLQGATSRRKRPCAVSLSVDIPVQRLGGVPDPGDEVADPVLVRLFGDPCCDFYVSGIVGRRPDVPEGNGLARRPRTRVLLFRSHATGSHAGSLGVPLSGRNLRRCRFGRARSLFH